MATLTKNRARKLTASGSLSLGYVNLSFPGLLTKKHVSITIGDYVLRIEEKQALELMENIKKVIEEHYNDF